MEIFKFYSDLFVLVHVQIRQCEFQWHMLHMECMASDWHDFLNVAWQTVDVRKARKMVMKIEIMYSTTYKTLMKNFRIFYQEKNLN